MTTDAVPALPVLVELSAAVHAALEASDAVGRAEVAVADGTDALLRELGVPGRAVVTVRIAEPPPRARLPLHITVDDRRCRYSDAAARRAAEFHLGGEAAAADWLTQARDRGLLVDILATVCAEALSARAGVLLGPPQLDVYRAGMPTDAEGIARWKTETLLDLLRDVLDLRLSLADVPTVARVLAEGPADASAARESLVSALIPDVLEIRIPAGYLREITDTTANDSVDDGLFTFLRRELFRGLGLPLPALRLVDDDGLQGRAIRFRVNALTTTPLAGMADGSVLVNDAADQLAAAGIDATPVTNPADGQPAAVVASRHAADLSAQGYTTWSPLVFLLLALAATVREHARCLVDTSLAEGLVRDLEPNFPQLVQAAQRRLPPWRLAALLRGLAAERVSMRNLRRIFDIVVDRLPDGTAEPDDAMLLTQVRVGLGRQISQQLARPGTTTVVSYLVGPDIEELLRREPPASEAELDAVAAAVSAELSLLPTTSLVPVMITTTEVRAALARLTAAEFSNVPVIAFNELVDTVVVQPIARLTRPETAVR